MPSSAASSVTSSDRSPWKRARPRRTNQKPSRRGCDCSRNSPVPQRERLDEGDERRRPAQGHHVAGRPVGAAPGVAHRCHAAGRDVTETAQDPIGLALVEPGIASWLSIGHRSRSAGFDVSGVSAQAGPPARAPEGDVPRVAENGARRTRDPPRSQVRRGSCAVGIRLSAVTRAVLSTNGRVRPAIGRRSPDGLPENGDERHRRPPLLQQLERVAREPSSTGASAPAVLRLRPRSSPVQRSPGDSVARRQKLGVFCVEHWSSRLGKHNTVEPMLGLLERNGRINYLHLHVLNRAELANVTNKWGRRQYSSYTFGYFGFQGTPGCMNIGRQAITLDQLAELLAGSCGGKFIYFGSCQVLDGRSPNPRSFGTRSEPARSSAARRRSTGANRRHSTCCSRTCSAAIAASMRWSAG